MRRRLLVNVALSLLVGAAFLYLAFRHVPLTELGHAFAHFDARWLVPAVAISLLLMVFRAWRWQLELRPLQPIGLGQLWIVTSVAYMAINLLPARLGEVVRPWLLSRRSSVSVSNVIGNLVVEKTMDAVVILFYVLLGLLTTANLPAWVRRGAWFPAAGALLLAGIAALLWWKGEPFVNRRVVRYLPESVGRGLTRIVGSIVAGMRVIPDGRLLGGVFLVSLALWFLPILSSYIMMVAFDFRVPFSAALMVFIFIGFGTALPQAPGMIGTYQYACVLALGLFGIEQPAALAYGLVLNLLQLTTLVVQGIVALPLAGISVGDLRRARAQVAGGA